MRLPDFIVIGTSRGGTTSLYHLLSGAEGVFMPKRVELHFFSFGLLRNPKAPLSGYALNFSEAREDEIVGEKSPSYFWFAGAAPNIRQHLPNVRLIATLRDPATRAISDFKHGAGSALDEGDLMQRIDRGIRDLVAGRPFRSVFDPAAIILKGMYGSHLRRFLELFGEDRLLLVDFDRLDDGQRVAREIARFIGAPSIDTVLGRENTSAVAPAAYEKAEARLREFYRKVDDYETMRPGLRIV